MSLLAAACSSPWSSTHGWPTGQLTACPSDRTQAFDIRLLDRPVGYQLTCWRDDRVERRRAYHFLLDGVAREVRAVSAARVDNAGHIRAIEVHRGGRMVSGAHTEGHWVVDGAAPVAVPWVTQPDLAVGALRALLETGEPQTITSLEPGSLAPRPETLSLRARDGDGAWVELSGGGSLRIDGRARFAGLAHGPIRMQAIALDALRLPKEPVDPVAALGRATAPIASPRGVRTLVLRPTGLPRGALEREGRQVWRGDELVVQVHLPAEIPHGPIAEQSPEWAPWLAAAPGLDVGAPAISRQVERIVAGARDRRQAVAWLVRQVDYELQDMPSPGPPAALASLSRGSGDCNEHAALFVGMARTAGIPARVVTGLVYVDEGAQPGFYPHAWAEAWMGPPAGWVAVDPAMGQTLADATHLALDEGLDTTPWELLARIADLRIEVVEAR